MYCLLCVPIGKQSYATTETKWNHLTFQFTSRNHLSSYVTKLTPSLLKDMNKIAE